MSTKQPSFSVYKVPWRLAQSSAVTSGANHDFPQPERLLSSYSIFPTHQCTVPLNRSTSSFLAYRNPPYVKAPKHVQVTQDHEISVVARVARRTIEKHRNRVSPTSRIFPGQNCCLVGQGCHRHTGSSPSLPKPNYSTPNLAITVFQPRSAQRMVKVRSEREQITEGNSVRNWLIAYGLGKSRLKKGKKTSISNPSGLPAPHPAKAQKSPPKKSHAIKQRVDESPEEKVQRDQRGVPWQVPRNVPRGRVGRRSSQTDPPIHH